MKFTCCAFRDWIYIDFQTVHFAGLGKFKVDFHFADIGEVKIDLTRFFFTVFGQVSYYTGFGQNIRLRKTI